MPARRIAALLAIASFAVYGQALLDDATIGKLVKAGVGEQTIVTMIKQQPGKYALASDDMIALKKAGVSDKILAAMIVRNGAADGSSATPAEAPPAAANQFTAPAALALHDATPIRLRLTRDLTFTNVKLGETVDFEILDDLRVDSLLLIARGRVTATITQAEPKSRLVKGGKLGVNLDGIPLLNGAKVAIRAAKDGQGAGHTDATAGTTAAAGAMVKPVAPSLLFAYGKDEAFPEGTGITVYIDGEFKLDPARFLVDMAFTSNPPGALVSMYGALVGRTPFTTRLAPGAYKAVFSTDGYSDLTQSISVGPGYSNTVNAAFRLKP